MSEVKGLPFLKATLNQARDIIKNCLAAQIVPFLRSSPGMGKSATGKSIAKEDSLIFIDIRLAGMLPENMNGIPVVTYGEDGTPKGSFVNFVDIFPTTDTPLPDGCNGWLINLDELPSAPQEVQVAAYRLILDRELGNGKALHPNVYVMAAGNLITDNAVVEEMSTALVSRVVTIELMLDREATLNYFIDAKYNGFVVAFLMAYQNMLHDFNPNVDGPYPCPRTWEMVSKVYEANNGFDAASTIGKITVQGCVGTKAAVQFGSFIKIYKDLPNYSSILADPKGANVPSNLPTKYATMLMLVNNMPEGKTDSARSDIKNIVAYIERFPELEVKSALFNMIRVNKPTLFNNPDILKLGKYAVRI